MSRGKTPPQDLSFISFAIGRGAHNSQFLRRPPRVVFDRRVVFSSFTFLFSFFRFPPRRPQVAGAERLLSVLRVQRSSRRYILPEEENWTRGIDRLKLTSKFFRDSLSHTVFSPVGSHSRIFRTYFRTVACTRRGSSSRVFNIARARERERQ